MDELEKIRMKKIEELMKKIDEKQNPSIKYSDLDEILKKHENVVVDFWAEWCAPCRILSPIIDELSKEYQGRVTFVKVNVDKNQNVAAKYSVFAVPTLIVFKSSKPVDRIIGVLSKSEIKKWIEKNVK